MSHDVRGTTGDIGRIAEGTKEITYQSSNDDRQRDRNGRFVNTASTAVSEADILAAIWAGGYLVTASGVAAALDVSHETALQHLRSLCESGILERKNSGSERVWHLPIKD